MERKPLSPKTRFEVMMRDRFRCQYCGRPAPEVTLEIDHIKPVSAGGTDAKSNLITACRDCNRGKGSMEIEHSVSVREIDAVSELYAVSGYRLNKSGRERVGQMITQYGFYAVYRASETAVERYCGRGRNPRKEAARAFRAAAQKIQRKKRWWFGG